MTTKIPAELSSTPSIVDNGNATAITIDSSELVGIGTSSPVSQLHVESSGATQLRVKTSSSSSEPQIIIQDGAGDYFSMQKVDRGMTFKPQGAEAMRIDSSGNVVIGGTTAYGRLNLHGTGSTTASLTGIKESSFTSYDDNGGTAGSISGFFNFKAATGIGGGMGIIRESAIDWGSAVAFYTHPSTTSNIGDLTERMRILGGGGVAIGDTTCVYALEVHGTTIFRGATYTGGAAMPLADNTYDLGHGSYRWDDIFATNNVINTSDRNKKNTITNSDLGLDFINRLSPKSYKLNGGTRTHYGLIAQDVETVLSDISKPTADFAGFIKMIPEEEAPKHEENPNTETTYGLRYGEFIAPLIKALQEADDKIEALTARIETLEGGE